MAYKPTVRIDRLQALLAYHEEHARAIRLVLDDLAADPAESNGAGVLDAALALDAARGARRHGTRPRGRPVSTRAGLARNDVRARSAQVLALFDPHEPRPRAIVREVGSNPQALGRLIAYGYLKKKGDGLIRTAKVYTP
jgi:hypothetical protein